MDAKQFIKRVSIIDKEANKVVGEGVLDYDDIVEIALNEVKLESAKAALGKAIAIVKEQELNHFSSMEGADWKEFVTEELFTAVMERVQNLLHTEKNGLTINNQKLTWKS